MNRVPSLEGRTFNSVFRADGHAPDGQVRYRIAGSGSTSWATESPTTASIVAAITEAGIAVRNVSMGSAANCDSYHLDADFRDGGLHGITGNYWFAERGAWIHGDESVIWVARLLKLRPPGALQFRKPPRLSAGLLGAFAATDYLIKATPEICARVGNQSAEVSRLLEHNAVESAVLVTAFNPFSMLLPIDVNRLRQIHLRLGLNAKGLASIDAKVRDPSGRWEPEPSFLVLGPTSEHVERMLLSYQQHAVVHMTAAGDVTLRFHPGHRRQRMPRLGTE
mgnify:FL=1